MLPGIHASFLRDVTAQRRVEVAGGESEALLRAIIETEPECVKLVDGEGRITAMNPAGLAMCGLTDEAEIRGVRWRDVVAPEHASRVADVVAAGFSGQSTTVEFELGSVGLIDGAG